MTKSVESNACSVFAIISLHCLCLCGAIAAQPAQYRGHRHGKKT